MTEDIRWKRRFGNYLRTLQTLAEAIAVPPRRINETVKGMRGITVDAALRLSVFFGTDAPSWINLQTHCDTELARVAMAGVFGRIVRRAVVEAA